MEPHVWEDGATDEVSNLGGHHYRCHSPSWSHQFCQSHCWSHSLRGAAESSACGQRAPTRHLGRKKSAHNGGSIGRRFSGRRVVSQFPRKVLENVFGLPTTTLTHHTSLLTSVSSSSSFPVCPPVSVCDCVCLHLSLCCLFFRDVRECANMCTTNQPSSSEIRFP